MSGAPGNGSGPHGPRLEPGRIGRTPARAETEEARSLQEAECGMKRFVTGGLVVAAAFAFTVLMVAGALAGKAGLPTAVSTPISYLCAYLIWPGMAITVDWLHRPVLGDNFFPLTLTFNTLVYSVVFGLLLWLFRSIASHRKNRNISDRPTT